MESLIENFHEKKIEFQITTNNFKKYKSNHIETFKK